MRFVVRMSSYTFLWLFAILRLGCGRDISNNYQGTDVNTTALRSSFQSYIRSPRATVNSMKRSCLAPRQPVNGEWRLHQDFCDQGIADCKVPEGTELGLAYQLIYSCAAGYKIKGHYIVFCTARGDWSVIPTCEEIRCEPLNTVSRIADCSRSRESVNCTLPALPRTSAKVSCRPGYRKDTSIWLSRRNDVDCNDEGQWEPQPIRCLPDCGRVATSTKPLSINGWNADIVDFPWHVTLYMKKNLLADTKKEFRCGGTIIQTNLVVTAAHCVYDEVSRKSEDPRKLFLMAGNTFRDWDHPKHDTGIIRRATVRQVYTYFDYYGLLGNYNSDIALLELQKPFVLSEILLPACLDTSRSDAPYLESGSIGKLAGFGVTATGETSPILQTITVPYISYADCRVSKNADKNEAFITKDKFCAGHSNGSAVCDGDSGGGLMFETKGKWYLMGIVSVSLGVDTETGARMCDRHAYTLYTKVADFVDWILGVIYDLASTKPRPSPNPTLPPFTERSLTSTTESLATTTMSPALTTTSPAPTTTSQGYQMFTVSSAMTSFTTRPSGCFLPPQPNNGQWRIDLTLCLSLGYAGDYCKLPPGMLVETDLLLIYSCDAGYKVEGNPKVYCADDGEWYIPPVCVEIRCSSLDSASLASNCLSQSGDWIRCDSAVLPKTRAALQCRSGFTQEVDGVHSFPTHAYVECQADGEWEPRPIKCTPACGQAITHRQFFGANGSDEKLREFPWHAFIYTKANDGRRKDLLCGATIIGANILLTAAHCVYNEKTNATDDPEKFYIMAGNLFRDYDSPFHDSRDVQKRTVKSVHIPCDYYGLLGNYAADIALLELNEPLQLSSIISRACLQDIPYETVHTLVTGAYGKISGFGQLTVAKPLSNTLKTITVPYVPYSECTKSAPDDDTFTVKDKFCVGQTNGSAICEGLSGGGLVFNENGRWYVEGVSSEGLTNAYNHEETCSPHSHFPYTSVSHFILWILGTMDNLQRYNWSAPCIRGT